MPLPVKIAIVILNWNGKEHTLRCLQSLQQATSSPRFSIVIVDNGSIDNSVLAIQSAHPEIPILETHANLGFAGGNNVGICWALEKNFEWVLLLNNDTVVSPDFLKGFMQACQMKPHAKILGAKIYRYHDPLRIDELGAIWNLQTGNFEFLAAGELDRGNYEKMQQVDSVCGCALLFHRSVPQGIGLLEERFFALWEESDFCARARRAGFEVWTAPQAKIWHKGSASFTGGKPHLHYFWWRNRLLWIERNCSPSEKKDLYRRVLWKEIIKCIRHASLKTLQYQLDRLYKRAIDSKRAQKAQRYRAGQRGIIHYFFRRFGNCPAVYAKKHLILRHKKG